MRDSVALRYAEALFILAKEEKKVAFYQAQMKALTKSLATHPELLHLLKSEFISHEERVKVVDKVYVAYPITIRNFLKVLIQNHRLSQYQEIAQAFNSLCNENNHVIEGIIYSTTPLEEKALNEIQTALSVKEKNAVELINRIDPSLIGGVKVVINNHVYDYSIASELTAMRGALKA